MSGPTSRPPTQLQPRLKSAATSIIVPQIALSHSSVSLSRPGTPTATRSSRQTSQLDPLSEKATISLIRRTLCVNASNKDADVLDLLPPLTSSNDVDLQLYALISIVIKDFIQTWYGKITEDKVFVEEVLKIIAHCTRSIESRLRQVDLESLIFDEIPDLLLTHVKIYRIAFGRIHPPPLQVDPLATYHNLWPSPALAPVPDPSEPSSALIQKENEAAYRQLLVEAVLTILLPTEDLESGCLTALISQIFAEMIIGNGLGGKACEPWLLWEAITKAADLVRIHLPQAKAQERVARSKSFGLDSPQDDGEDQPTVSVTLQKAFWLVLEYAFVGFTALRLLWVTISNSAQLPDRSPIYSRSSTIVTERAPMSSGSDKTFNSTSATSQSTVPRRPVLAMKIWSCASCLLDVEVRMPWLCSLFSILQWALMRGPGAFGDTNGLVDKLLSSQITNYVLNPESIPTLLQSTRAAIFPNNTLGPARIPPSPTEILLIRRRCAESILGLIPRAIQEIYFGKVHANKRAENESSPSLSSDDDDDDDDEGNAKEQPARKSDEEIRRRQEIEEVLNCFNNEYCNRHFIYGIVELIVARVFPEMTEKGVEELWKERFE